MECKNLKKMDVLGLSGWHHIFQIHYNILQHLFGQNSVMLKDEIIDFFYSSLN